MESKTALSIMSEKRSFLSILKSHSLFLISGISLIGILFSGYLTFKEVLASLIVKPCVSETCSAAASCSQQILGLPTCAYGLAMYLVVFVISLLGKE